MKLVNKTCLSLALAFGISHGAVAALITYTGSGGKGLVYSSVSNITWTQDANLFDTLANSYAGGYSAFVSAVIDSVPEGRIYDTPNYLDTPNNSGYHSLSVNDFNYVNYGLNNWYGSKAFAIYLNSVSYGGSNQWRLPVIGSSPLGSELSQLLYNEIDITGISLPNIPIFNNFQGYSYWTGTEYESFPAFAFNFITLTNGHDLNLKNLNNNTWVVSEGYISPVPEPESWVLMLSGLLGIASVLRRKNHYS